MKLRRLSRWEYKKEKTQHFLSSKPPIEIRYRPIGFRIEHPQGWNDLIFWGFLGNSFGSIKEMIFKYTKKPWKYRNGDLGCNFWLIILGFMFTWDVKTRT